MKWIGAAFPFALLLAPGAASADPWKDESGKGKWRGQERYAADRYYSDERKEKYVTADGCEIERKWKNGEYEAKMKCKAR